MEHEPSLFTFALLVFSLSLSGVMAPGPMSAVTVFHGTRNRFAGLRVATGHAVVEIPVIFGLFHGIDIIQRFADITAFLTLAGSVVLFIFATLTLKTYDKDSSIKTFSPLIDGMALSAFNPYFFIWWLTIGLTLIQKSSIFGLAGCAVLLTVHIACDYMWLLALSMLAHAGASLLGKRFKTAVGITTAVVLYGFGLFFMYTSLTHLL